MTEYKGYKVSFNTKSSGVFATIKGKGVKTCIGPCEDAEAAANAAVEYIDSLSKGGYRS